MISINTYKNWLYITTTFVVAFCSIIYELIFAQALTVVFGSTVMQYSLTIGIFMFFLGVGSFFVDHFLQNKDILHNTKAFVSVELSITASAILGLYMIIAISSVLEYGSWTSYFWQAIGFLPVATIGFLSGAELPIMTNLYDNNKFAQVLGIDYFGSLLGTVLYALLIFPSLGLFGTTVIVSALNAFVAVAFLYIFFPNRKIYITIFTAMLFFFLAFYLTAMDRINKHLEAIYLGKVIENVYDEYGIKNTKVIVTDVLNTPYQTATEYDIYFNFDSDTGYYTNKDHCLNLDRHLQACGDWTESYHHGLVDVPLSMLSKKKKLNILILGGGDFIPAHYLTHYDKQIAHIEIVDIDKTFQNFAKRSKFLRKYNQEAYNYGKLHVTVEDALTFLKRNHKKYDLVLWDLPGLKHEKLLPLYSTEFYTLMRRAMNKKGMAVSWYYPSDMYPEHAGILQSTLHASGFKKRFDYVAYNRLPNGAVQETEQFFILSKDATPEMDFASSSYVKEFKDRFKKSRWHNISSSAYRPNSIFRPNYGMIITYPKVKHI